jgi:hypothetical protein
LTQRWSAAIGVFADPCVANRSTTDLGLLLMFAALERRIVAMPMQLGEGKG